MLPLTVILAAAVWLGLIWLTRVILDNPREDVPAGLFMIIARLYVRLVHRLRVEGIEHLPRERWNAGPMVVVSNHTAGVDPVLIQALCRFEIKFMMAADMQHSRLAPLWEFTGVIPVDRSGGDIAAARAAIRYLRSGGVIGIFPEGCIVRTPHTLGPFLAGFGLMIRKTGARVLPVTIEGTPDSDTAFGSLTRRSRSVVRFHPVLTFDDTSLPANAIVEHIRERMLAQTGWAAADDTDAIPPGATMSPAGVNPDTEVA